MNKRENNRSKEIRNIIILIAITAFIGISTMIFYITCDKTKSINYTENSDIDYKVFLKENDFYSEEYLGKDKGYIASLIDSIQATFKYNLDFSDQVKYRYSYRIAIEVDVEDEKNESNIYHFSEDLVTKVLTANTGNLKINEDINVNYGDYNNVISRFKDVYDLNNTSSTLNINLYVNVEDINNNKDNSLSEKKVSSLSIPLTENTVSIDIGDNTITNSTNKIMVSPETNYTWVLRVSCLFIAITIAYIIYLVLYISKTRTAQMIYEKEIKSIMSNYDSYIQKISGSYDIGTSQVIKIEKFNDMLEIRDTLKQPILMLENEEKNGTFFIIPATNSIIYTYALRVVDIRAKMEGKEIPTYDITEIPHADFKKKKKYTDKYIKNQITMTAAMPTVDERNVIKGTKDPDSNLYSQLERTSSFDIREIRKARNNEKKESNDDKPNYDL